MQDATPILIVCEDEKSFLDYIKAKIKSLELTPKQNPVYPVEAKHDESAAISVVNFAIDERNSFNRERNKRGQAGYGKVYCVMDVDPTHGKEQESLRRALNKIDEVNRSNDESKLIPIISNECVEVWYLLHFEKERPPALHRKKKNNTETVSDHYKLYKWLEKHLGQPYTKDDNQMFSLLAQKGGDETNAIRLAKQIDEQHKQAGSCEKHYCENPSTRVYQLIERLNGMNHFLHHVPFNPPIDDNLLKQFGLNPEEPFVKELARRLETKYIALSTEEKLHLLADLLKNPAGMIDTTIMKDFGDDNELVNYFCTNVNWVDQSDYLLEKLV